MACVEPRALNSPPRNTPPCKRTARSTRSSVREVFRARIVLLAAEGKQNRNIAEQLGTGPDSGVEMEAPLRREAHGRSR